MKAIFVSDDSVAYATVDVDQLGVLANLQSLLNLSSDMSKCRLYCEKEDCSDWTDL